MATKNNIPNEKHGILISKMKKGNYCTKDATKKVINYILRAEGSSKANKSDVLCQGAYGAIDFLGENFIIKQFNQVSSLNPHNRDKNRYIDHQIFAFSDVSEKILEANPDLWRKTCSDMTSILSDEQHQVAYALHKPDSDCKHLHLHFAVNTVDFHTGNKRQENWQQTAKHQEKLNAYLEDNLSVD